MHCISQHVADLHSYAFHKFKILLLGSVTTMFCRFRMQEYYIIEHTEHISYKTLMWFMKSNTCAMELKLLTTITSSRKQFKEAGKHVQSINF